MAERKSTQQARINRKAASQQAVNRLPEGWEQEYGSVVGVSETALNRNLGIVVRSGGVLAVHDPKAELLFSEDLKRQCIEGGWEPDNPMFLFRPSSVQADTEQAAEILRRAKLICAPLPAGA